MNAIKPEYMMQKLTYDEEKNLVSECVAGSKPAWDRFVTQYSKLIYSFIYRTLDLPAYKADKNLVEDLFQDVFLGLMKDDYHKLKSFGWKNGSTLATWLRIVTSRMVLDHLRKQIRHKDATQSLDEKKDDSESGQSLYGNLSDKKAGIVSELLPKDELNAVLSVVQSMSSQDQLIFKLIFEDDIDAEDIARTLNKSVDAVYMQKKRMLDKLKKILKEKNVRY